MVWSLVCFVLFVDGTSLYIKDSHVASVDRSQFLGAGTGLAQGRNAGAGCVLTVSLLSQRVARVLWNQLNKETREHHVTCVELFYRLHCLAPTANICEDIICHALLDPDKVSLSSLSSLSYDPNCQATHHCLCPGQTYTHAVMPGLSGHPDQSTGVTESWGWEAFRSSSHPFQSPENMGCVRIKAHQGSLPQLL